MYRRLKTNKRGRKVFVAGLKSLQLRRIPGANINKNRSGKGVLRDTHASINTSHRAIRIGDQKEDLRRKKDTYWSF